GFARFIQIPDHIHPRLHAFIIGRDTSRVRAALAASAARLVLRSSALPEIESSSTANSSLSTTIILGEAGFCPPAPTEFSWCGCCRERPRAQTQRSHAVESQSAGYRRGSQDGQRVRIRGRTIRRSVFRSSCKYPLFPSLTLRQEARKRRKASLETFCRNPAGNQPRPAEPGQQPEASLAWGEATLTAKRRQRDQTLCD